MRRLNSEVRHFLQPGQLNLRQHASLLVRQLAPLNPEKPSAYNHQYLNRKDRLNKLGF